MIVKHIYYGRHAEDSFCYYVTRNTLGFGVYRQIGFGINKDRNYSLRGRAVLFEIFDFAVYSLQFTAFEVSTCLYQKKSQEFQEIY